MPPPAAPSQTNKATPSVANTLRDAAVNGAAPAPTRSRANFIAGDTITVNGTIPSPSWRQAPSAATSSTSPTTSEPCWPRSTRSRERRSRPRSPAARSRCIPARPPISRSQVTNTAAFAALGFTGTATATRGGGGTIGTGQVVGNDNSTFLNESVAGGAVTTYDVSGSPVNLQFRWAKTDSASLGAGHTDTWNLFYQVNPNATGTQVAWQNVNTNFTFSANGPDVAGDRLRHAHQRRGQRRLARQPRHQLRHRRRHPVRRRQRQRAGQPDPAGRLPGRPAAVGRRQRPTAASSATIPTAATSTSPKSRSRTSTAPTSSSASTAARSR